MKRINKRNFITGIVTLLFILILLLIIKVNEIIKTNETGDNWN